MLKVISLIFLFVIPVASYAGLLDNLKDGLVKVPAPDSISGMTYDEIFKLERRYGSLGMSCLNLFTMYRKGEKGKKSEIDKMVSGCESSIADKEEMIKENELSKNDKISQELVSVTDNTVFPSSCPGKLGYRSKSDIVGYTLGSICHWDKKKQSSRVLAVDLKGRDRNMNIGTGNSLSSAANEIIRYIKESNVLARSEPAFYARISSRGETYFDMVFDPFSDSISSYGVITKVIRNFCGEDATNALSSGNSFRDSLEEKYGTPDEVKVASMISKDLKDEMVSTQNKIKHLKRENPVEAYQLESGMQEFLIPKLNYYRDMGGATVSLSWIESNGEEIHIEVIEDFSNVCDGMPYFHMSLENKKYKEEILEEIGRAMNSAISSHGQGAKTPTL